MIGASLWAIFSYKHLVTLIQGNRVVPFPGQQQFENEKEEKKKKENDEGER
jgi:hypothetical protein